MRPSAALRRDRLAQAAAVLFHRRGYHGVALRDIALEAGVPAGAVFYHFPTKAALACAAARAQLAWMDQVIHDMQTADTVAARLDRLGDSLAGRSDDAAAYGCPMQRLLRDLAGGDADEAEARALTVQVVHRLIDRLTAELTGAGLSEAEAMSRSRQFVARWAGSSVLAQSFGDPAMMRSEIAAAIQDLQAVLPVREGKTPS